MNARSSPRLKILAHEERCPCAKNLRGWLNGCGMVKRARDMAIKNPGNDHASDGNYAIPQIDPERMTEKPIDDFLRQRPKTPEAKQVLRNINRIRGCEVALEGFRIRSETKVHGNCRDEEKSSSENANPGKNSR